MSLTKLISLVFICCCVCASQAGAQGMRSTVMTGVIVDAQDGTPLPGANVFVVNLADTTLRTGSVTDPDGHFTVSVSRQGNYRVRFSYVGYATLTDTVRLQTDRLDLGTISLRLAVVDLEQVVISGAVERVVQKGDTTEYNAAAYKVNQDATAEDLVAKMPGITVQDGKVQAQGEDVMKVTIDGKEFFGDDAITALRALPAEIISRVQVYDRQSEQAQFTGFKDENAQRTINIVTRSGRSNGRFGRLSGGYGTDDRYNTSGSVNTFSGDRRITLTGSSNNMNQSGGRGSYRGGGGQSGINRVNSFNVNYIDEIGKKLRITGNYGFGGSKNENEVSLDRQYLLSGTASKNYSELSNSGSNSRNHRFNLNLRYNIDSTNALHVTPRINFSGSSSNRDLNGFNSLPTGIPLSRTANQYDSKSNGFNAGTGILYQHRFGKPGRTISAELNAGLNDRGAESNQISDNWRFEEVGSVIDSTLTHYVQRADNDNSGWSYNLNVAFTEPIGKEGQLQLTFNPSSTQSASSRLTHRLDPETGGYDVLQTALSNEYDNRYNTERGGATYRVRTGKTMLSFGVNMERVRLSGDQTLPRAFDMTRSYSSILPRGSVEVNFTREKRLRINYNTSTNTPSIDQLQDVIEDTNPLFLSSGNPDLRQSYAHHMNASLHLMKPDKGRSFMLSVNAAKQFAYIGNATVLAERDTTIADGIVLPRGGQWTHPVNLDGHWNARTNMSVGLPAPFFKSNLNLNASASYSQVPSLLGDRLNTSRVANYNGEVSLSSRESEKLDYSMSYQATFSNASYSLRPERDRQYWRHSASGQVEWLPRESIVLETNARFSAYTGEGGTNTLLWNASVGYKFLERNAAELRLVVVDILNRNGNIGRSFNELYIENNRSQVLGRYIVLNFSYRIRNFRG